MLRVLVRGIGDIGSAVAQRLFVSNHAVVIHDSPQPTATRRGMAFVDAVFDGAAVLERVRAERVDDLHRLPEMFETRSAISVVVGEFGELLGALAPDVLIDARMRKRDHPEVQRGWAPLTIGLGPNFVAGTITDLVVETSWEHLGQIITGGSSLPLQGEPLLIAGHARDRYRYAPVGGTFRTAFKIGDAVRAGEVVAHIGSASLTAPLDGILRGLTHDGVPVSTGTKVIEVDPRGDPILVRGIGERPASIADSVLEAVQAWAKSRDRQ